MNYILDPSTYRPDYMKREDEDQPCPHCGKEDKKRTNRYLFRCLNPECGRYW